MRSRIDNHAKPGEWVVLAIGWMLGVILAKAWPTTQMWLALALVGMAGFTLLHLRQHRGVVVRRMGLVCVVLVAASWSCVSLDRVGEHHIRRYLVADAQLARLRGVVNRPPQLQPPQEGAFAGFTYESPVTSFGFQVREIFVEGQWLPSGGQLIGQIAQADHRMRFGQEIELVGWLSPLQGPTNPGEFDYRTMLQQAGVEGRITLRDRDNWQALGTAPVLWRLGTGMTWMSRRARDSLHLGINNDKVSTFLDLILLGQRQGDSQDMRESFRLVGLAHLLAISGAHLGILLGLVWLGCRLTLPYPRWAAYVVLSVLGMYLLIVPLRIPIIRAGIMAGCFGLAYALGRRVRGLDVLAMALIVTLILWPGDLFTAGFQLSYVAVAVLIVFTRPLAEWFDPTLALDPSLVPGVGLRRWGWTFLAVNIVGFIAVWPLAAYHFQLLTPLTMILAMMSLPLVVLVMGLGYFKLMVGLVLPSAGQLLAGPVSWSVQAMLGLVAHAAGWPGASIPLPRQPSLLWLGATMAVMIAWLAGRFRGRKAALAGALALCLGWLAVSTTPEPPPADARVTLNMFSVGDGSCYLLRINPSNRNVPFVIMFDCGSQNYLNVGQQSIAPALQFLGVKAIDLAIISHADIDHYGGTLDVQNQIPIHHVLMQPYMLQEARDDPQGPAAFLVNALSEQNVDIESVTRGWTRNLGDINLKILWPPPDLVEPRSNDTSIVLAVTTPHRRLLLTGDIAGQAMTGLMRFPDELAADVTDLPHHGSFVPEVSPPWLARVNPAIVLQSSGPYRLRLDQWAPVLQDTTIERLISHELGMVELIIDDQGRIRTSIFKNDRSSRR